VAVSQDEEAQTAVGVGDKLLFAKYAGAEIKVDGTPHPLVETSDILARITD
jgi:co-chaperonin GroES (HSP10)